MSLEFSGPDIGRRVRLVHTDDPYTLLRCGDEGTVTGWNAFAGGRTLFVDWDSGSSLGLVEGVDRWEWIS